MLLINVKVLNLVSRTNETRYIEWYETCKCKCTLDASVYNNKQRWNDDKCRCECKKLIDKGVSDKGFIWNPSNCECQCDKSCDVGEYLNYENCKCRKKSVDQLKTDVQDQKFRILQCVEESIEECTETVKEVKPENENKPKCSSFTLHIVLLSIIFTINVGIATYFVYSQWYLKKDVIRVKFGSCTQTTIKWEK